MPTLRRTVLSFFERHDERWIVYFSLVLAGMYAIGQLSDPFIAHDDFDWLNFQFDQGFESPWSKTFSEGRWLNFPWSYVTQFLTVRGAFLLHLTVYSLFVWVAARLILNRSSVVASLLLFSAPMAAEASLWPVTQVTGAFVSLVAIWGMLFSASERSRVSWMAGGVFVGYLCYPSFGPILLLLAATRVCTVPSLIRLGAVYVVTFVGAILFVFFLNWIFHGAFSIRPASWRAATPLLEGGTLQGNVERYLTYYSQAATLWPGLATSAVAYVVCFWHRIRWRECGAVIALGTMLLAMDGAISVISGVGLWLRASLWLWLLICVPVVFLIGEVRSRMLGLVLAAPLLVFGALAWFNMYQNVRNVFPAVRTLAHNVATARAMSVGDYDSIVVYGDVHDNEFLRHMHSNRALRNFVFKEYGWYTTPCSPALCDRIEEELAKQRPLPLTIVVDRVFVIVLSENRGNPY